MASARGAWGDAATAPFSSVVVTGVVVAGAVLPLVPTGIRGDEGTDDMVEDIERGLLDGLRLGSSWASCSKCLSEDVLRATRVVSTVKSGKKGKNVRENSKKVSSRTYLTFEN